MIDLDFRIDGVEVAADAATPQLLFRLNIEAADSCRATTVQAVLLRVQLRIEPVRRNYPEGEPAGLVELFGPRGQWGAAMRSMLWTHVNLQVPAFTGATIVDLPVECSFDFNVAATKYFAALDEGAVPLCFLFSGTSFYQTERGLQAAPISWEREAPYRLPIAVWRELMATYYPNRAWLCIERGTLDRLSEYKVSQALPGWEQAIERLLEGAGQPSGVAEVCR